MPPSGTVPGLQLAYARITAQTRVQETLFD
jgi:hypothetical protein